MAPPPDLSAISSLYLTTRELASLLHIKERKVYELVAGGEVPHTRATGKLLFPRDGVEQWIARNSGGPVTAHEPQRPPVLAGSHDPLLEWAIRESESGLATLMDGSVDGVERFARNEASAVGLHVYSAEDRIWNTRLVAARFAAAPVVLIEFAWRLRGLVVTPARAAQVRAVDDLRGSRVVPRQSTAGSQILLEHLLSEHGVGAGEVHFIEAARTETDAVLALAEGRADVTLGLESVAAQFGMGFVPLIRERFDLLVDRRLWFEAPMQRFITFCASESFAERAAALAGYEVDGLGRVHFNGAI